MRKISVNAAPSSHVLNLLEGRWREESGLARLLRCAPNSVHGRLRELAEEEGFTVLSAGNLYAILRKGWKKKALLRLIRQTIH